MKKQNRSKICKQKSPLAMLLTLLLFMLFSIQAQAVIITKDFTGLWLQPDHESQGFDFQVINQNGGVTQAVVYWYTYDTVGNPMWLIGMGNVVDNQVSINLMTITGVTNLQENDPSTRNEVILATADFSFDDCQNGTVDISPKTSVGSANNPNSISGTGGIVRIQRLTSIKGSECSGGISDNTPAGVTTYEIEQSMENTGIYTDGYASLKFEQNINSSEFEVEVEDIPVGTYDLRVDNIIRGQIQVANTNDGTEGELEFESPIDNGKILLDFDPRNKFVEILDQSTVIFSSNFAPEGPANTNPEDIGAPPFANGVETRADFINTGLIASAKGEVELEQELAEVEFEVEIENLPTGNYGLYVDGDIVGTIMVVNDDGGTKGELKFRFPEEAGKSTLDFDPRGKLIEVRMGDVGTLLEVNF